MFASSKISENIRQRIWSKFSEEIDPVLCFYETFSLEKKVLQKWPQFMSASDVGKLNFIRKQVSMYQSDKPIYV